MSVPASPPRMNIDWLTVQKAIVAWVREALELPESQVYWGHQDNPQAVRPFVCITMQGGFTANSNDSLVELSTDEDDKTVELAAFGQRQFRLAFDIYAATQRYGEHAVAWMASLESSLGLPEFVEILTDADVAVVENTDIRDLSELAGGKRQSRAQMEITFNTKSLMTSSRGTGYIDSAVVTGVFNTGVDGEPIERTNAYGEEDDPTELSGL